MLNDPYLLLLALLAAFCIGLAKSGFTGLSMISVVIFAEIYGAKASVGLALPLLIAADLIGYPAFRKHGSWKPVWMLLPATLAGLLIGWWLLGEIEENTSRRLIAICVLFMVGIQIIRKAYPIFFSKCVESPGFGISAGMMGGFSTMLANAAGPIMQLYFLTQRFPKMDMIGISARFFLLVNLLKIPLNARLALITSGSLWENAKLMPAILLGLFVGRYLIRFVPQGIFEGMVVAFSTIAALRLLL